MRTICCIGLCVTMIFLSTLPTYAETCFPSYESFSNMDADRLTSTQNSSTSSIYCITNLETINAYQVLLESEYNFLLSAKRDVKTDTYTLHIVAYTCVAKEQSHIPTFQMDTSEGPITCHILMQHYKREDGMEVLSLTWSSGLTQVEYVEPTPTPEPEPTRAGHWEVELVTTEIPCWYCHTTGKCPDCGGTGKRTNPYTGEIMECSVIECPICEDGYIPNVKTQDVWVWNDEN